MMATTCVIRISSVSGGPSDHLLPSPRTASGRNDTHRRNGAGPSDRRSDDRSGRRLVGSRQIGRRAAPRPTAQTDSTPSCRICDRTSTTPHVSTTRPLSKRKMKISAYLTELPVAGRPMCSPRLVPVHVPAVEGVVQPGERDLVGGRLRCSHGFSSGTSFDQFRCLRGGARMTTFPNPPSAHGTQDETAGRTMTTAR